MPRVKSPYKEQRTGLYLKSFCAYLDILGFKSIIKEENLSVFNKYLNVIKKELSYIDKANNTGIQNGNYFALKVFTDNFVFGHPIVNKLGRGDGEVELDLFFQILAHLQFSLVKSDFFIRGAVSLGNLYMDSNVVLGPALIEAYSIESNEAIYPRITLSEDVVQCVNKYLGYYGNSTWAPQAKEFLIDIDGYCFINYLSVLFMYFEGEKVEKATINELVKHKQIIEVNLKKHATDYKLFEKYAWVARYHNFFCSESMYSEYLKPFVKSIIIDDDKVIKQIKPLC